MQQTLTVEDDVAITVSMITPASVLAITSSVASSTEVATLMAVLPRSVRWMGRLDRPWGLGDEYLSRSPMHRDLEVIRMGKDSWFFRADGLRSYDNLREAFVGERLSGAGSNCGCVSSYGLGTGAINSEAQTEFMREVLTQILLEMPDMDLDALCDNLFGGQRQLCEHYLWWLENESFVAHPPGQERQDRLLLTDEGCTALAMLELTKPGSNVDLSPRTVHILRERERCVANLDNARSRGQHEPLTESDPEILPQESDNASPVVRRNTQ